MSEIAPTPSFTFADFLARARARLHPEPPASSAPVLFGDHVIDPSLVDLSSTGPLRAAAVLVPIVEREEPSVLLTRRADTLSAHGGQIAFPGGRIDPDDPSPLAAALREADEEIGLDARRVAPLGYLDAYRTTTGFRVVPVVALIEPPFALAPNPAEVADVFEVPLAFLMSADNHVEETREWRGRERRFIAMPYGERYIWGVTAGILKSLQARLFGP